MTALSAQFLEGDTDTMLARVLDTISTPAIRSRRRTPWLPFLVRLVLLMLLLTGCSESSRIGEASAWREVTAPTVRCTPSPTPPTPKPLTHPRPIPARTLAVLEDVRTGLLGEAVAARHGLTEFYVGRLAKQHGVARSQTDPGWCKRKYGAGVRSLPMPTRPRTCGIWKRVTPMPRWPRATGARSRASPTRRTGMGFDGGVRRNSSLRGA